MSLQTGKIPVADLTDAQAKAEQCGHLVDQTFGEHRVGPLRQSLIEKLCVAI